MTYYRTCPLCGYALDPGERCDCRDTNREETESEQREKAAPVVGHRDGQAQQVLTDAVDASIISEDQEEKQV